MADDYRIHLTPADPDALIVRLHEAEGSGRFAVSRDGDEIFVYASTPADAQRARDLIGEGEVERWIDEEDRWSGEAPGETWEEEEVDAGHAPWEVRVDCGSHHAANELADGLEAQGYSPVRRWSYLIIGTTTREDADALAARLHGQVEAGGELVWEARPGNPFAIFGGLGDG